MKTLGIIGAGDLGKQIAYYAINDKIEAGTVIETDKTYIFVGVSVPIFKYAEKDVISVSEDAPIFKTLKAKKTGENLEFGKNSFKILKIN